MKVLFIKPRWEYPITKEESTYNRRWPPLSLLNCASFVMQAGHQAQVIDAHALKISDKTLIKLAQDFDKVFITSSDIDRWQCPNVNIEGFINTAKAISLVHEDLYVMGYHCTRDPSRLLELTGAKGAIRLEPEETVKEICEESDLGAIEGLSFRDSFGNYINNANRRPLSMAQMPSPAFHLLDYGRYNYEVLGGRFALFETSRGCAHNCLFCDKTMYPAGLRRKDVKQIKRELEEAIKGCGVKNGYFIDLDFISDTGIIEELCDYLISKAFDFRWTCQSRASKISPQLFKKMRLAGCSLIHFGVESGSERLRKNNEKYLSNNDIFDVLSSARACGIRTACFFIFNLPGEIDTDLDQTFEFIKKGDIDYISAHLFTGYLPAGELSTDELYKHKKIIKKILKLFYLKPNFILKELLTGGLAPFLRKADFFLRYLARLK